MVHRRAFRVPAALAASVAVACASSPAARIPPGGAAAAPVAPAHWSPGPGDARLLPPVPAPEDGGLSFSVEPTDAEVVIDGRSHGSVVELARNGALKLPPGLYQVSLRRPGYATWRAEVAVRSGIEPIRVTLSRRSSAP